MAQNDWAVVIGIWAYPGFPPNLNGPKNDVGSFVQWLTSPKGGAVPTENVIKIISPSRRITDIFRAKPTTDLIDDEVRKLQDRARREGAFGRRLYLYFAGHGIALTQGRETAVFTANADRLAVGAHVIGEYIADWLAFGGGFQEVVLFMDCCRQAGVAVPAPHKLWGEVNDPGSDKVKRLYILAAKWSRLANERKMADGKVHGVFTTALLQGLQRDAQKDGQVTGESLGNWFRNSHIMEQIIKESQAVGDDANDGIDPDIAIEPDVLYSDPRIVLTTNDPVPGLPVTIHMPAGSGGMEAYITNSNNTEVVPRSVPPNPWQVSLPSGFFAAHLDGQKLQAIFQVAGGVPVEVPEQLWIPAL